jgi:hypothetical protein
MAAFMIENGDDVSTTLRKDVEDTFGTMGKAMLSLYMAVTGGNDWSLYYEVISNAGGLYTGLYLFFTFFFIFAIVNILTGIFVEKAVVAASPDRDDMIIQQRRKARQDASEFRHMCQMLDAGHDGMITWEAFEGHMHDEVMVAYMASVGLEVHEVELFFKIVCGAADEGKVSIDRFVDGCMQMKGAATGIDVQKQLFEFSLLHEDVKSIHEDVKSFEVDVLKSIQQIEQAVLKQSQPCRVLSPQIVALERMIDKPTKSPCRSSGRLPQRPPQGPEESSFD